MKTTYTVLIWKMRDRINQQGPDFDEEIDADSLEDALRGTMIKKRIQGSVYAEVLWNGRQKRTKFEDYKI